MAELDELLARRIAAYTGILDKNAAGGKVSAALLESARNELSEAAAAIASLREALEVSRARVTEVDINYQMAHRRASDNLHLAIESEAARKTAERERERLIRERLRVDRRIHNQRLALRENYATFEQRADFLYRYRLMKRQVDRCLATALRVVQSKRSVERERDEAREAEREAISRNVKLNLELTILRPGPASEAELSAAQAAFERIEAQRTAL